MLSSWASVLRILSAIMFWGFLCPIGRGDSWGSPTTEFLSRNGLYALKVSWPAEKKLTLFKSTPAGEKEEIWSRAYIDENWPPYTAYVADDGQHVVLRDVYHNLGHGKVLVFLGPKGEVLKNYELADLLTQDQILISAHTVSSIWWSMPGWFSFLKDQRQFAFVVGVGASGCFDVATGKQIAMDEKQRGEVRSAALRNILPVLKSKDPSRKVKAITLCGALKATEAVQELKQLLRENTQTGRKAVGMTEMLTLSTEPDYAKIQVAAAEALVAILKVDAVPLIEEQLAGASPATRQGLLRAIARVDDRWFGIVFTEKSDSVFLLTAWHRLSESHLKDVREFAIQAILERDNALYVYDHSELLTDVNQDTRFHAVCCLVNRGDKQAIPFLRVALKDSYSPTRLWAFRGLLKYKPEDLDILLQQGLKDKDYAIRETATVELIRQGNREAMERLFERIAAIKNHSHGKEEWVSEEFEATHLCDIVIELKLSAAEPMLRQAYSNSCENIRRPVSAALAALGDQNALKELRQFIRKGDALERAESIRMLGLVGDTESLIASREALKDREPWVQEAAKETIVVLEKKLAATTDE
jgi:HEAT repeat protein